MAEKLRKPQQAIVGSKTRSAGRAPPRTSQTGIACKVKQSPNNLEVVDGHRAQQPALRADGQVPRHVEEKLARLEKHDHRVIRVEVEVEAERNPRQADRAVRVELTAFSKGPVVRAEAAADDKMAALDLALDKMAGQMRRAADRKRVHRGRHTPTSVSKALAGLDPAPNATALTDEARRDRPATSVRSPCSATARWSSARRSTRPSR